jgi:hypothetical protein
MNRMKGEKAKVKYEGVDSLDSCGLTIAHYSCVICGAKVLRRKTINLYCVPCSIVAYKKRSALRYKNRIKPSTCRPNPQDHPGPSGPRVHPVVGPLSGSEQ